MIQSMTGYGAIVFENEVLRISIEVKSLNSKFAETTLKLPRIFSEKEIFVRNRINAVLGRGKIYVGIELQDKTAKLPIMQIDKEAVLTYYKELKVMAGQLGESSERLLPAILQLPNILKNPEKSDDNQHLEAENTPEQHWELLVSNLDKGLEECKNFRIQEGQVLALDLKQNIHKIIDLLAQIEKQDPTRISAIREKFMRRLETIAAEVTFDLDKNRFEQELIYYLEKMDINEEKVRLLSHLTYFVETIEKDEQAGKKLGFIAQEIGREINTIGSKVSEANMQRIIVEMKEELEKIKEQSLNIL